MSTLPHIHASRWHPAPAVFRPSAVLVDTNVIRAANGQAPQALPGMAEACAGILRAVMRGEHGLLLVDRSGPAGVSWIIEEYCGAVAHFDPHLPGDVFLRWVRHNEWDESVVRRVGVTPSVFGPDGVPADYAEFPRDFGLADFEPADRKFVAVAIAYRAATGLDVPVFEALDSDFFNHETALARHGVRVARVRVPAAQEMP